MQIFSNPVTAPATAAAQTEDAGSSSGTGSSSSTSSTGSAMVTANDFLQLLVTELKNQDPTANTDPNEYINQLVQVNSLEQLISINQDLTPSTGSGGSAGTGGGTGQVSSQPPGGASAQTAGAPAVARGNLSAPNTGASTTRIVSALSTAAQTLAPGSAGSGIALPGGGASPMDSMLRSLKARAQQTRAAPSNPAH